MANKHKSKSRIYSIEDRNFFNSTIMGAENNFEKLPPPLPWIDPSINMPYLESVSSFVFGQYFSAILAMSSVLEHCLRIAVLEALRPRWNFSKSSLNKYQSISALLAKIDKEKKLEKFKTAIDIDWWKEVVSLLRNKSTHLIIPDLLANFNTEEYLGRFTNPDFNSGTKASWGFVWHRFMEKVALNFISKSNRQLNLIIQNTSWQPMTSCWESQKCHYDRFFSFDWSIESAIDSLKKIKAFEHINK